MLSIWICYGILCLLALVSLVLSVHICIAYNGFVETVKNWSQSLSDDCNSNLNAYYNVLISAVKKDVDEVLTEYVNNLNKEEKE